MLLQAIEDRGYDVSENQYNFGGKLVGEYLYEQGPLQSLFLNHIYFYQVHVIK